MPKREAEDDYLPSKKFMNNEVGEKLIKKMGWSEGRGLGLNEQGDVDVIPQSKQKGRRGLGYSLSDIQIDAEFEWTAEKEEELVKVHEEVNWMPVCKEPLPTSEEMDDWFREGDKKITIDDEDDFCDSKVLRGVLLCKSVFDSLSGDELRKARSGSNPFETLEKGIFQNRAAMKMANLDAVFDWMFTEPVDEFDQKMVKDNELLYFADICAGPGGFSEYVLWKKRWHAKGFGFTLRGENDFKLDEFFAGSPETFEPHYGDGGLQGNGNIYEPKNLIKFRDFVLQNTDKLGVHFVMADGGFSVEGQENIQEILSKRLYLCQFLCALAILRRGGSFVCKLFDILTPFSVGLVYLMYRNFQKVTIHKPNSSRPANSERYLICKWKTTEVFGSTVIENYLFKLNCILDSLDKEKSTKDIIEVVPFEIINDDVNFRNYIYKSNTDIGKRQILFLSKVKAYVDNPGLLEERQSKLKKDCLEFWKVPSNPRTVPQRMDAHIKFRELISKNKDEDNCFAVRPKVLTFDNLKLLEYFRGFQVLVLGSENDDLQNTTSSSQNVRGFFLGMGRQTIYYWDGCSNSKWSKFDIKLELPPETLFYGEQVQELKGEGKGQRKMKALHIIDSLFLGGDDVRHLSFESRRALTSKMVKAVTKLTQTEYSSLRLKNIYDLASIELLSNRLKEKECKGSQKTRLCYEIDEFKFFIPYGLLIIQTVNSPWILTSSRSTGKLYYFNTKNNSSLFDQPAEAKTSFKTTFSNLLLWKWNNEHCQNSTSDLKFSDIVDFIEAKSKPTK